MMLAASLATGLSGCTSNMVKTTHEREVSLPDAAVGAIAVDVSNVCGSVEIRVDPRYKSAKVEWFAIGNEPEARQVKDARGRVLKDSDTEWVATDVGVDHGRTVLRVLTSELDGKRVPVRLLIMVPACAGVRVRNSEGPVTLSHVSGAVDVLNGVGGAAGGQVTAMLDGATKEPVSISTTNADVNVSLGRASAGTVTLTAPAGRVSMRAGKESLKDVKVAKSKWSGVMNGGENAITIHADDGLIHLEVRDK